MAAVREAFADLFEFSGMTFVESLRTFLANFKMPGESMLIERLMTAFARVRFLPARLPVSPTRSGFRLHMLVLDPVQTLAPAEPDSARCRQRFFECNPGFVAHLTHEKVAELRQSYDAFLLSVGGGAVSVRVEQLVELVKSLGGDFKWMKDAEIAE